MHTSSTGEGDICYEVWSHDYALSGRWRNGSRTDDSENHFDAQYFSVEQVENRNSMTGNFLFTLFSSSTFTFLIILALFAYVTKWSLADRKAYAGYVLGWFMALLLLMVVSSLSQQAPENQAGAAQLPASEVQLSTFQVSLSITGGLIFALFNILFVVGDRFRVLRDALHVTFLTTLILVVMFNFFIVGDILQRMLGIFIIAFGVVTLFMAIIGRQIERSRHHDNTIRAPETNGAEAGDVNSPSARPGTRRNRVQEIQKRLDTRSEVDPLQQDR